MQYDAKHNFCIYDYLIPSKNPYLKKLYAWDWNICYYKTNSVIFPVHTTLEKFFYSICLIFKFSKHLCLVANLICLFHPLQNLFIIFFCCWPDRFFIPSLTKFVTYIFLLLTWRFPPNSADFYCCINVGLTAVYMRIYNLDVYPFYCSAQTDFRCEFL